MKLKIIKNAHDYKEALDEVERLIDVDPAQGTEEENRLEILSVLIEKFEKSNFTIGMPDPIEAIKYRMSEMNLRNKDLIGMIGSKSKVSEVLHYKVPLSLRMIRALHNELGIPAEVLLQEQGSSLPEEIKGIDWLKFPLQELRSRGWIIFEGTAHQAKEKAEELLRGFFEDADYTPQPISVHLRQNIRSNGKQNYYAMHCWLAKVKQKANKIDLSIRFDEKKLNQVFINSLVRLSTIKKGPIFAKELLEHIGVKVVVLQHVKATHLDGACLWDSMGNPIIALTLRHDRVDNFWFTLFHELGHLKNHMKDDSSEYVDDLEAEGKNDFEIEADNYATHMLIPPEVWAVLAEKKPFVSRDDIIQLSQDIMISPAIVAGRVRKETKNYRLFKDLVGYHEVRKLFDLE